MALSTRPFIVLTDVDGTLLDHHDYGFAAAAGWLARLRGSGVPVVLCTSKTRAEVMELQPRLGLEGQPFIAENGAVTRIPTLNDAPAVDTAAPDADRIADILSLIRDERGFRFTTFAEADDHTVADWTGLSVAASSLARQREASAVLRWEDGHADERLRSALADHGLALLSGGRFWHVLDAEHDKGRAARRMIEAHRDDTGNTPTSIGLGDAPNDTALLDAVDLAIIVRGAGPAPGPIRDDRPERVYRTTQRAPEGWAEGLDHVLDWALPRAVHSHPSHDHARSL